MQGVIYYISKEGDEKKCYFSGMRYDEQPKDVLEQKNIEYEKILECCTEDWKKNREYISGWKINSIRFYYWKIGGCALWKQ